MEVEAERRGERPRNALVDGIVGVGSQTMRLCRWLVARAVWCSSREKKQSRCKSKNAAFCLWRSEHCRQSALIR